MSEYPHRRRATTPDGVGEDGTIAAFLKARMTPALETQDPTELHYLLAQLDDFSFVHVALLQEIVCRTSAQNES